MRLFPVCSRRNTGPPNSMPLCSGTYRGTVWMEKGQRRVCGLLNTDGYHSSTLPLPAKTHVLLFIPLPMKAPNLTRVTDLTGGELSLAGILFCWYFTISEVGHRFQCLKPSRGSFPVDGLFTSNAPCPLPPPPPCSYLFI